jgi:adenine-specific DNA-methyltransferase
MPELLTTPALPIRVSTLDGALRWLRSEFTVLEIKAAVIAYWAEHHGYTLKSLESSPGAGGYLAHLRANAIEAVEAVSAGASTFTNLAEVEDAFERLLDARHRKDNGVVYTPDFIAKYLITEGFKLSATDLKKARFCDPCCGGAVFVLAAAQFLNQQTGIPLENALRDHIWGFDLNPIAIEDTQCLAELFLLERGRPVPHERLNFHVADAFMSKHAEVLSRTRCPDGFDLIATNPPYVKLQNLAPDYRTALIERYPDLASGSFSLAMIFLIAAQRWLAPSGMLAVITQNNIFSSLAAEEVRRQLQVRGSVRRILDFGHNRVFANASAYTCLVFCGKDPTAALEYDSIRGPVTAESLACAAFASIPTAGLNPTKWRLAARDDLENLRRIEAAGVQLGEIADIRVGFATLKDRAFLLSEVGGVCRAIGPDGQSHEIEKDITQHAVKIAAFDNESEIRANTLRIICPYEKSGSRYALLPESIMVNRFPAAHAYLGLWRSELAQRDKGRKEYEAWYAWGRTQGLAAPGPKLLTKTFSRGPNFMMDESDSLFCNGYAVFSPRPMLLGPQISLRALQSILNSIVMFYYARLTSFQIEGGFECYQKNFIEHFGIPPLSADDCRILETHTPREADLLLAARYGIEIKQMRRITGGTEE